jgi:hypothetical protein
MYKVALVFNKYDLNNDKVIDKAEFAAFMNAVSTPLRMQSMKSGRQQRG